MIFIKYSIFSLVCLVFLMGCKQNAGTAAPKSADSAAQTAAPATPSDPTAMQFNANFKSLERVAAVADSVGQNIQAIRAKMDAIPDAKKKDAKYGFRGVHELLTGLEKQHQTSLEELAAVKMENQKLEENSKSGAVSGTDAIRQSSKIFAKAAKMQTAFLKSREAFDDVNRYAELYQE